jgi:hypothetical protein
LCVRSLPAPNWDICPTFWCSLAPAPSYTVAFPPTQLDGLDADLRQLEDDEFRYAHIVVDSFRIERALCAEPRLPENVVSATVDSSSASQIQVKCYPKCSGDVKKTI